MKCKNCGFEINIDDLFCGNCGEPVKQSAEKVEEKYINIGYPVGYAEFNNEIVCLIDNGLQQVQLSQELFSFWAKMPQETPEASVIPFLEKVNCLLNTENSEQLDRFMNCVPYRQGFGAAHDGKHVIVLGNTPIYMTEKQMIIWRLADGRNTLKRICMICEIDDRTLIDEVMELVGYDLIYLKFAR